MRVQSVEHTAPITEPVLPEQFGRGIPRAVLSIQEPSPIGYVGQQYPSDPAERSAQMSDRRIDTDDHIQTVAQGRRVSEIMQII